MHNSSQTCPVRHILWSCSQVPTQTWLNTTRQLNWHKIKLPSLYFQVLHVMVVYHLSQYLFSFQQIFLPMAICLRLFALRLLQIAITLSTWSQPGFSFQAKENMNCFSLSICIKHFWAYCMYIQSFHYFLHSPQHLEIDSWGDLNNYHPIYKLCFSNILQLVVSNWLKAFLLDLLLWSQSVKCFWYSLSFLTFTTIILCWLGRDL